MDACNLKENESGPSFSPGNVQKYVHASLFLVDHSSAWMVVSFFLVLVPIFALKFCDPLLSFCYAFIVVGKAQPQIGMVVHSLSDLRNSAVDFWLSLICS